MKRSFCIPSARVEWLVIVLFVLANLSWIARSTAPWPDGDSYAQATSMLRALDQGFPMTPREIMEFLETMSHGGRAPLYQLSSIPFVLLFGESEDGFSSINLGFLVILMVSTGRLATEFGPGRWEGTIAIVAVACFAPLVHMVAVYRLYYGAVALIALTAWLLARAWRRRGVVDVWLAAIASSAAVLMHPMAIPALLVPMATVWIVLTFSAVRATSAPAAEDNLSLPRRILRNPLITRGLLPATLVPMVLVGGWYLIPGRSLLLKASQYSSTWITTFRGTEVVSWLSPRSAGTGLWYMVNSPFAISWPLAVLVACASAWLLWRGNKRQRALVVWMIAAYVFLGFRKTFNWYYGAFGFPFVAAVLGIGVTTWRRRTLRNVTLSLVVIVSLVNFSMVAWGASLPGRTLARYWGANRGGPVLLGGNTPVSGYWPLAGVVARIARDGGPKGRWWREVFIGPDMLAPPCNFIRQRYWKRVRIRFLHPGEPFWGHEFPVRGLLMSRWIIISRPLSKWLKAQNPYQRAVAKFFQNPPLEFRQTHRFESAFQLPDGEQLRLLRRTAHLTVEEVDATMESLGLPPRYVTQGALVAAGLLEKENRVSEAIARLKSAAAITDQPANLRARILARAARLLAKHGEIEEARRVAKAAAEIAPTSLMHTGNGLKLPGGTGETSGH